MTRREVMETLVGEMMDMIACLSIYEGGLSQKGTGASGGKVTDYLEAMKLR